MSLHESDRPQWKCSYCGRTFGFKSNFTKHVKTVHEEVNERKRKKKQRTESPVELEVVDERPRKRKRKPIKVKATLL